MSRKQASKHQANVSRVCGRTSDRASSRLGGVAIIGLATFIATTISQPSRGAPPMHTKGRWSIVPDSVWRPSGAGGTHLVLLRGNGDSTRVLHFHDNHDPRLWLWNSSQDTLSPSVAVRDSQDRVFCAGQVVLKDGRAFVVGGTTANETGTAHANIFDPKAYGAGNSFGWIKQDSLKQGRWYPGVTLLGSGKALVSSGHNYFNMVVFGGATGSGATSDLPRMKLLRFNAGWNADPPFAAEPAAREGHTAAYDEPRKRALVWGGQDAGGTDSLLTIWELRRTDKDDGEKWTWTPKGPGIPDGTYGLPRRRTDHASVLFGDSLYFYAGRNLGSPSDTVLDDVWRLRLSSTNSEDRQWERIVPQAGGPGPRYHHVVAMDPGQCLHADPPGTCTQSTPVPQLVVFGGRRPNGTLCGDTVWALPLPRSGATGTPQWSVIATGGPGSRAGHTFVRDPYRRSGYTGIGNPPEKPRIDILCFAGEGSNGLKNDTWSLTRTDTNAVAGVETWAWREFVAGRGTADSTSRPPKRVAHSVIHDIQFDRMLVFAGDTTGSGARVNDVWALNMNYSFQVETLPSWELVTTDSTPTARSGQVAVFEELPVMARLPERYTAPGAAPQSEVLDYAQKRQPFYPHMFLLKSGELFWTGNVDSAGVGRGYTLDLGNTSHPWQDPHDSELIGGGAVMFRPDSVMKCGGNNVESWSTNESRWIAAGSSATWKDFEFMKLARANHNVTLLPTGQVLATGGKDPLNGYRYWPEMWTRTPGSSSGSWGDTLAADPYKREYHSTAVLLPDARVLVSGGPPSDQQASVFWPPYLFADASGTLRARPQITGACELDAPFAYGDTLKVTFTPASDAIGSVCLIRPGATTHQYDMNQRYVPLSILGSGSGYVTVKAPADSNEAPPGDYMLFIVRKEPSLAYDTPSVARWVRLQPDIAPPYTTSDLAVDAIGPNEIDLVWTAPGDDSTLGRATIYDFRYSTSEITEANFSQASSVSPPPSAPQCAGGGEFLAADVGYCTWYWFALKTRDEVSNWSAMSNVVKMRTCVGGGGAMASSGGEEGGDEGMVLGSALPGDPATDRLVLQGTPDGGALAIRLSQAPGGTTRLDAVQVKAVDHAPGESVFATGGGVVVGTRRAVLAARRSSGEDITRDLTDGALRGLSFKAGDTLLVGVGSAPGSAERAGIAIEALASGPHPEASLEALVTRHAA